MPPCSAGSSWPSSQPLTLATAGQWAKAIVIPMPSDATACPSQKYIIVYSGRGGIFVGLSPASRFQSGVMYRWEDDPDRAAMTPPNAWFDVLGFGVGSQAAPYRDAAFAVWLPDYFLIGVLSLFAVYCRTILRRRFASGLCPVCGYDLRATPDKCPECGTARTAPAVAASD